MHTHIHTHACMHKHAYTHICVHTRTHAHTHTHARTHTHTHTTTDYLFLKPWMVRILPISMACFYPTGLNAAWYPLTQLCLWSRGPISSQKVTGPSLSGLHSCGTPCPPISGSQLFYYYYYYCYLRTVMFKSRETQFLKVTVHFIWSSVAITSGRVSESEEGSQSVTQNVMWIQL